MEANSGEPFINLSSDNVLEELTEDVPSAREPEKNRSDSIKITDVHNLSAEKQKPDNDNCLPREKRLKCPECSRYTTTNADQLTRHIRKVHRGENPFQCFMCDYSTYNKTVFEEHIRIHKGIKPFKCSYCSHRNVSKKNLKRHEKIHRPDNPLKCPHCVFIARNMKGFNGHILKYHPIKVEHELACNWCNKKFTDESSLVLHTAQIKTCDAVPDAGSGRDKRCDYRACSTYRLKLHREAEHGLAVDKKMRRDLWKCGLCEWSAVKKTKILLHLIHHPNQTVDENVIDVSILRKHGIMM